METVEQTVRNRRILDSKRTMTDVKDTEERQLTWKKKESIKGKRERGKTKECEKMKTYLLSVVKGKSNKYVEKITSYLK